MQLPAGIENPKGDRARVAVVGIVSACASHFRSFREKLVHSSFELGQDDLLHVFRHIHPCTVVDHLLQLEEDAHFEGGALRLQPCGCFDDQVVIGELEYSLVVLCGHAVHNDVEGLELLGA